MSGVQTSHFLEEGSLKLEGGHPPVLFVGRLFIKIIRSGGFFIARFYFSRILHTGAGYENFSSGLRPLGQLYRVVS